MSAEICPQWRITGLKKIGFVWLPMLTSAQVARFSLNSNSFLSYLKRTNTCTHRGNSHWLIHSLNVCNSQGSRNSMPDSHVVNRSPCTWAIFWVNFLGPWAGNVIGSRATGTWTNTQRWDADIPSRAFVCYSTVPSISEPGFSPCVLSPS